MTFNFGRDGSLLRYLYFTITLPAASTDSAAARVPLRRENSLRRRAWSCAARRRPARAQAKWQDSKSMFLRSLSVKNTKRNEPIRGNRLDNSHMTTYNIRRGVAFKPAHAGITRHRARGVAKDKAAGKRKPVLQGTRLRAAVRRRAGNRKKRHS